MGEYAGGGAVAREMQHGRPKQRVEVQDVFADKVVHLGVGIGAEIVVELNADAAAQVFKRSHIAYGRIEPHIKIFARRAGDFKAEIGRVARDVPVRKRGFAVFAQPLVHFV